MPYAAPDGFDREIELRRQESGVDWAEAAVAERYSLSPDARYGLHLVRRRLEGYKVEGKGTLIAQKVACEELAVLRG